MVSFRSDLNRALGNKHILKAIYVYLHFIKATGTRKGRHQTKAGEHEPRCDLFADGLQHCQDLWQIRVEEPVPERDIAGSLGRLGS